MSSARRIAVVMGLMLAACGGQDEPAAAAAQLGTVGATHARADAAACM